MGLFSNVRISLAASSFKGFSSGHRMKNGFLAVPSGFFASVGVIFAGCSIFVSSTTEEGSSLMAFSSSSCAFFSSASSVSLFFAFFSSSSSFFMTSRFSACRS